MVALRVFDFVDGVCELSNDAVRALIVARPLLHPMHKQNPLAVVFDVHLIRGGYGCLK
jgi:hypothetical protein